MGHSPLEAIGYWVYEIIKFKLYSTFDGLLKDADEYIYYWSRRCDGCNPSEICKLSLCCCAPVTIACLDFNGQNLSCKAH